MKKVMMICGLVLGVVTFTNAQDSTRKMPSPEDRAKRSTARLAEKLTLSEAQKAKVLALYTEQAKTMQKETVEARKEQVKRKEERKAQMVKNDAKINDILTADQKKAYEAMKVERKAKMDKRGDRKKGDFKGRRMHRDSTSHKAIKTM